MEGGREGERGKGVGEMEWERRGRMRGRGKREGKRDGGRKGGEKKDERVSTGMIRKATHDTTHGMIVRKHGITATTCDTRYN